MLCIISGAMHEMMGVLPLSSFPPSTANLQAMKMVDSQRVKLSQIMHQLEGGIIIVMTIFYAIYIPVGYIYAIFTL